MDEILIVIGWIVVFIGIGIALGMWISKKLGL
jgi:uncharacterized protein YneF (UPF0154 family)